MHEDILLQVNKPARYIGGEWNVSKKHFDKSYVKFALSYPDLYEIGMSNLGFRIIYSILNNLPDVCCERFFSPQPDLQNLLEKKKLSIFSLESKKNLRDFDIIGFSLCSELNYTNVLNILELGSIPLSSFDRDKTQPLVIAGGPCAFNPEPMHAFFDLFVIGEAEEVILEIIEEYKKYKRIYKRGEINKLDLLLLLSQIEGVYVPSLYDVKYDSRGNLEEFKPKFKEVKPKIKKRFILDLNRSFFPSDWLVPYIQIVHDRITLEIMRGCPNRCRFCQARVQYFPFRKREMDVLMQLAKKTQKNTGYEEICLSGLSVSDYPHIETLIKSLVDYFKTKAVSICLPSLKAKSYVGNLSMQIAGIKKTGLTFAPEAGTDRLRRVLSKDFDEQVFFKAIENAYLSGYQHIKLYFMIGLPSEEILDLDAIIDFSQRASILRKKIKNKVAQINISINALIPRPHTPLQWLGIQNTQTIKSKIDYLKRKSKNKKLKFSFHNPDMSFLESVFSRGDRNLSDVVFRAFKKGARLDAWSNYFLNSRWLDAFAEAKINPEIYRGKKSRDEILPWDFIDTGIDKKALLDEFDELSECTIYGTE